MTVTFSYDPPEQTLAEIMCDAVTDIDEADGCDPGHDAARMLHGKLMLHGQRHTIEAGPWPANGRPGVVLRLPYEAALSLADLLDEAFKPPTS